MNIVDTIQKLLRLTTARGASVGEAAAAAAAAQRLADKYRLQGAPTRQSSTKIRWFEEPVLNGEPAPWRVRLLMRIAHLNECEVLRTWQPGARRGSFTLVGTDVDATITRHLYAYLEKTLERLVRRFGPDLDPVWGDNFRLGAIDAIEKRLAASVEVASSSMAIVRVKHRQRVRDVASSVAQGARVPIDTSGPFDASGRAAGTAAGRKVALDGLPATKDEVA